jgi:hypothetical protein
LNNCPNCGTQVPADADFCPRCGQDLRPRKSTFPWVPTLLAFVAGVALAVVIGLVAGVGKTDTVTDHAGGKHPVTTTTTVSSTKRVPVKKPAKTVTATGSATTVTSTATVSTTATTTTTVSTTKTVTGGG